MKTSILLLLMCFLIAPFLVKADHILAGSISYTYLTDDTYQFLLKLNLDCDSDGPLFDNPAFIAIYKGNAAPYLLVDELSVPLDNMSTVTPQMDDCVEEPFPFCITEGQYIFSAILPDIGEDYHVVYQRCCRSSAFTNLIDPSNTGITIATRISAQALQLNNSSPILSSNPIFEVCSGEEFNFNLSATDENADTIIYTFCNPLRGGGSLGSPDNPGNPNACNGVLPIPPCPPLFDLVSFILPTYSSTNPLGSGTMIQLDPSTGEISGIPNLPGQFLAGVCITEYINGEVISESLQELVFWVDFINDVSSPEFEALSFFPNPAEDKLYIDLPESSDVFELSVRDISGKLIHHNAKIEGFNYELDVDGLKGLYFLELRSEDRVYLGKVVIL